MEIVHNHDNDHLHWLFHWNIFPLRESTSVMPSNGKGFTLEELSLEKISVFQTLLKLCVNCGIPTNSTMAPQCGNSFSTVVPHKKIMEETAKCGITVEYRRIYLNCGKTVEKLLAYSVTWI